MTVPTLPDSRRRDTPSGSGSMPSPYWTVERTRMLARFAVAIAASGAICLVLAKAAAPALPRSIENVGFPSFYDYNYLRLFWKYRLVAYLFPALTIAFHALLTRWGPLHRMRPRAAAARIALVDAEANSEPTAEPRSEPQAGRPHWSLLPRIGLPAAVVVIAAGSAHGHTKFGELVWGVGYAAAVGVLAATYAVYADRGRLRVGRFWHAVPLVNTFAASAGALLGLWYVSARTVVITPTGDQSWPWFPLWLALVGIAAAAAWALRQHRRGRDPRTTEASLVTVLVGSVLVFLFYSVLPQPVTTFQGFDDALEMAGANLLSRGLVPWRDMLFVHGLFPDVLTGSLGRAVFGDTIWGIFAIHYVVLTPLAWAILYLFAYWVSNGNKWFAALFGIVAVSGLLPSLVGERFIAIPVVLILLGETLRRRSVAWAVGLTLLTAVQAILVPETSFLAAPVLACVVAADLVHRRPGVAFWPALRLSRWAAATGAGVLLALFAVLAAYHAVSGFIDYYLVVGPGHNDTAAMPPSFSYREYGLLGIELLAVLATMWLTAARVGRRGNWYARDWVAVAAGGFMALYFEKALGRLDGPHVWQNFGASLGLGIFWAWLTLRWLGLAAQRFLQTRAQRFGHTRRWLAGALLVNAPVAIAIVVFVLVMAGPLGVVARGVDDQHRLTAVADTKYRLGYAAPTAIDPNLLHDLDVVVRTYAGDDGTVFDLTNSPGYLYFLLGRNPGNRFSPVVMAETPFAQRLLIQELQRSRPKVVIFDATKMGLATWDGISNNVRHYLVSRYLLQNWTPAVRTHGTLVLVRRDLAASVPLPQLAEAPQVSDLYFSGSGCWWGTSAAYLPNARTGTPVTLGAEPMGRRLVVHVTGQAVDPATGRPATSVVVANGAHHAIATVRPEATTGNFDYASMVDPGEYLTYYTLSADGSAHPLSAGAASGTTITLSDGRAVEVTTSPGGRIDSEGSQTVTVSRVAIPNGITISNYPLATLSSGSAPLDSRSLTITDRPGMPSHDIAAGSLSWVGSDLTVRVGSCTQWYGYDPAQPLYVLQDGGRPVTSITLSEAAG